MEAKTSSRRATRSTTDAEPIELVPGAKTPRSDRIGGFTHGESAGVFGGSPKRESRGGREGR